MDGYILKRKAIDAVYAGIKLYHNEHHPQKGVYDYILDVVGEIETEDVSQKCLAILWVKPLDM